MRILGWFSARCLVPQRVECSLMSSLENCSCRHLKVKMVFVPVFDYSKGFNPHHPHKIAEVKRFKCVDCGKEYDKVPEGSTVESGEGGREDV